MRTRAREQDDSRIFAFCKNQSLTLKEFDQKSDRLANALLSRGIKKGEKVAIISHSSLEYLVCEYATFKIGAVCVPFNCLLKSNEFAYLLENADAVLAFVHSAYLKEFLDSRTGTEKKIPYVVMDENPDAQDPNYISLRELVEQGDESPPLVEAGYTDPCCILYTSGTTGAPKGVVYENYAMLPPHGETYVQQMMDVIHLGPDDTTYLPFALYHVLGQVHVIGALRNGGRIALAERFSASQFWNEVRACDATVLVHQGASIPLLLRQGTSELDKEHHVRLSVGAGVPNEEVWKAFEQRFGVKVFEHYAQTEGAFFGAGTKPTNEVGTVGLPYDSAEIRLIDENEREVREGDPGQLVSRLKLSIGLVRRKRPEELYYKDPEKGRSRFTRDGWFKSGDIVRVDERGFLHYVGKVETFIRYRGENISPLQIESVLSKHPAIEECIAVGVQNKEFGGDDIKVVIALKQGASLAQKDLISWCESAFPRFMVPRYIECVKELEKTEQTKKILRNAYKDNTDKTWDRFAQ